MKPSLTITLGVLFTLAGMLIGGAAVGESKNPGSASYRMQGMPPVWGQRHRMMESHRVRGNHRKHHGHHGSRLLGPHWKGTLTAEQRAQIDQMHVLFAKAKAPVKARVKALKADLALLITGDMPDSALIEKKINELLAMKKRIMQMRYVHIADMRSVLTVEQRASFDMDVLDKAKLARGRHH